jgi:hypothetical protein
MTIDQLKNLSPAEKYDIFTGRYDFPTVRNEWLRTSPDDAGWEGLCHGWAPASVFYLEPHPVTLNNSDGIPVPFGSSDVKALLTFFAAEYSIPSSVVFLARRCNVDLRSQPEMANSSSCVDVNAGSLHVLLVNLLTGNDARAFQIDRDRSIQVWNQPVFSFDSNIDPQDPNGVVTTIRYAKETAARWDAHDTYVVSETYRYNLDIANGTIVGGSHKTWDRPDFAWDEGLSNFYGYFSELEKIYLASLKNGTMRTTSRLTKRKFKSVAKSIPHAFSLNHATFKARSGTFALKNYRNNYKASWSIRPAGKPTSIILLFNSFATERYRDRVRIYENADGTGALIAVLHGSELPYPITISASSALVVFASDSDNTAAGFEVKYLARY